MSKKDETCRHCRFFDDYETTGVCRRYAPRPRLVTEDESVDKVDFALWPAVQASDFCGEWETDTSD